MQAMIFAAGLGTRLKPLTDTMPKALVQLGGQTLLERLICKMRNAGVEKVVVNVHHFADMIIDYMDANHGFGIQWAISDERNQLLETGGGLKKAQPLFDNDQPILIHNVDILSNLDFCQLIKAHNLNRLATLVVSQRQTQRYLLFDSKMQMTGWTNIATGETRPTQASISDQQLLAFSGIQIVNPQIFNHMDTFGNKFSITDLYIQKCSTQPIIGYVPHDYLMMDVGKISQIEEAQSFAAHLEAH